MLSAYETGKHRPSLDTTERVLKALDCDVLDLIAGLQIVTLVQQKELEGEPRPTARALVEIHEQARKELDSMLQGNESADLDAEEREVLSSLLPGVLRLIRYLKR